MTARTARSAAAIQGKERPLGAVTGRGLMQTRIGLNPMLSPMQKSLVLILARDLADKLASAVFLVDRDGILVYFNDKAGEILGRPYAEAGNMPIEEWTSAFPVFEADGRQVPPEELPLLKALREQQPAHQQIRVEAADGQFRDIAVTALPLMSRTQEVAGAMATFWEVPSGEAGGR